MTEQMTGPRGPQVPSGPRGTTRGRPDQRVPARGTWPPARRTHPHAPLTSRARPEAPPSAQASPAQGTPAQGTPAQGTPGQGTPPGAPAQGVGSVPAQAAPGQGVGSEPRAQVTGPGKTRATGAQALVYALERVGADVVFGIPGRQGGVRGDGGTARRRGVEPALEDLRHCLCRRTIKALQGYTAGGLVGAHLLACVNLPFIQRPGTTVMLALDPLSVLT